MRPPVSSRIVRTTLDLDPTVLQELKHRQQREGKSLGQLASELLAVALAEPEERTPKRLLFKTQRMEALIDIEDHEAVRRALEDTIGQP